MAGTQTERNQREKDHQAADEAYLKDRYGSSKSPRTETAAAKKKAAEKKERI